MMRHRVAYFYLHDYLDAVMKLKRLNKKCC